MINKSVDEAVFDAILAKAFRDAAEEDMKAEALDQDLEPVKLTPEHLRIEERAYKRYETQRNRRSGYKHYAWVRNAVSCILIAGTIGFGTMFAIPPVRAVVMDVVIEFFEKYTSFDFGGYTTRASLVLGDYKLGYIPDGYELTEKDETRLSSKYTLTNADTGEEISIRYVLINAIKIQNDAEYSKHEAYSINGKTAYLVQSDADETLQLVYSNDTHVITITGKLSSNELLRILKNIS